MRFSRYTLPALLWASVIFSLSTGAGGASHTNSFVDTFLAHYFPHWSAHLSWAERDALHYYLRKAAHVTEYAVFGAALLRAIRAGQAHWTRRMGWGAWAIASVYAATDEFHQSFVPGRTPKVTDVCIDAVGAALGIGLYALFSWFLHKRQVQFRHGHSSGGR